MSESESAAHGVLGNMISDGENYMTIAPWLGCSRPWPYCSRWWGSAFSVTGYAMRSTPPWSAPRSFVSKGSGEPTERIVRTLGSSGSAGDGFMTRYVLGRIGWVLVVLLAITVVTFGVTFLSPVDPAKLYAGMCHARPIRAGSPAAGAQPTRLGPVRPLHRQTSSRQPG